MPHLNAKLNATFGFLGLPILATKAFTIFGKIAADEYSRYMWRHIYELFVCGHIVRLTIRVLDDSSTALITTIVTILI